MARDDGFNLVTSPPFYCYREQAEDVCRLQKTLCIMSPVHMVQTVRQMREVDRLIFFRVVGHRNRVPADMMKFLKNKPGTTIVSISLP